MPNNVRLWPAACVNRGSNGGGPKMVAPAWRQADPWGAYGAPTGHWAPSEGYRWISISSAISREGAVAFHAVVAGGAPEFGMAE